MDTPGPGTGLTGNSRFDRYRVHLSVEPDSELIDQVALFTAANTPDRDAAGDLLGELAYADDKPEVVGDSAAAMIGSLVRHAEVIVPVPARRGPGVSLLAFLVRASVC